jgi:hypothetical protein
VKNVSRVEKMAVELSLYHNGSLNRNDMNFFMNNATHIFEEFAIILRRVRGKIASYPQGRHQWYVPAF